MIFRKLWWMLALLACGSEIRSPGGAGRVPIQAKPALTPSAPPAVELTTNGAATPGHQASPSAPPPVTLVRVPGDRSVRVAASGNGANAVMVYFHGRCGNPAGFAPWAATAQDFGTLIALEGEIPCKGGRRKWSQNSSLLDQRIRAAIASVSSEFPTLPLDGARVLIGYSAGALRAEALATRYPERYPRAILIAPPRPPKPQALKQAQRVLLMAGEYDVRYPLKTSAMERMHAGQPFSYLEIPLARHGDFGPKAEETMRAALGWALAETAGP